MFAGRLACRADSANASRPILCIRHFGQGIKEAWSYSAAARARANKGGSGGGRGGGGWGWVESLESFVVIMVKMVWCAGVLLLSSGLSVLVLQCCLAHSHSAQQVPVPVWLRGVVACMSQCPLGAEGGELGLCMHCWPGQSEACRPARSPCSQLAEVSQGKQPIHVTCCSTTSSNSSPANKSTWTLYWLPLDKLQGPLTLAAASNIGLGKTPGCLIAGCLQGSSCYITFLTASTALHACADTSAAWGPSLRKGHVGTGT